MSERYSKLFSLPENLYAEGAPVIVSAGNLLKDNQTGKVLAQLKIRNIAAKPLKAATVLIRPQDAAGKPMASDTQQKYLDLTAKTGEEFGQKTAVFLPDASARGFSVEVTQAVFSDNSTWEGTDAAWEPLPAPESLSRKLGDAELLKQFQLKFGGKCDVAPQEHKDLWLCACGAWNRGEKCYACGKSRETLSSLDLDALKTECDARLAQEKAEREVKEAADKAAAVVKAKRRTFICGIAVLLFIAVILVNQFVVPYAQYIKAMAQMEQGDYENAFVIFEKLGSYKDSPEQKKKAVYEKALALIENGAYEDARELFSQLGSYKDSRDQMDRALYLMAIDEVRANNYIDAAELFLRLGSFQDSAQQLTELYPYLYEQAVTACECGKYEEAKNALKFLPLSYQNKQDYLTLIAIMEDLDSGYAVDVASLYTKACSIKDEAIKQRLLEESPFVFLMRMEGTWENWLNKTIRIENGVLVKDEYNIYVGDRLIRGSNGSYYLAHTGYNYSGVEKWGRRCRFEKEIVSYTFWIDDDKYWKKD